MIGDKKLPSAALIENQAPGGCPARTYSLSASIVTYAHDVGRPARRLYYMPSTYESAAAAAHHRSYVLDTKVGEFIRRVS